MWDRTEEDEELRLELGRVASEIDERLLAFASPEAREEWAAVCARWAPAAPAIPPGGDDLAVVVQKALRFSEILQSLQEEIPGLGKRRPLGFYEP